MEYPKLNYDASLIAPRINKMMVLIGPMNTGKTHILNFVCSKLVEEKKWTRIYSVSKTESNKLEGPYKLMDIRKGKTIWDRGLVLAKDGKTIFVLTPGDILFKTAKKDWYAFGYSMSDVFIQPHKELEGIDKFDLVVCACRSLNRRQSVKAEINKSYGDKIVRRFSTMRVKGVTERMNYWESKADKIIEKMEEALFVPSCVE